MKTCFKCLLIVFAILFLCFFLLFAIVSASFSNPIIVADGSILEIQLTGSIPEYIPEDDFSDFFGFSNGPITMHNLRIALDIAADDDRIDAVVIYFNSIQISSAQVLEIRSMIERFRESDKPIIAVLEFAGNADYMIAASCSRVIISPEGQLYLHKLQASVLFLKETLAKAGIEADFLHVGKYKSAPEQFTRTSMSPASREQYQSLLFKTQLIQDSILMSDEDRPLNLESIYRTAIFDGFSAMQHNLVDTSIYEDVLIESLEKNYLSYDRISLNRYVSALSEESTSGRIAVIYVTGAIMPGGDGEDPVFGSISGASRVINNIRSAARSRSIKGIIIRIDSPGGASLAADLIYREILLAKEKKPVIASVGSVAASGGYYVAMACDTIIANRSSILGSIGVFMGKYNLSKLKTDLFGLKTERILPEDKSDINLFSTNRNFTDQEKRVLQTNLDRFYQRFIQKVADSRHLEIDFVESIAQGRVWNGDDAMKHKLIDEFGDFDESVRMMSELIGSKKTSNFRYYPQRRSFFDKIERNIDMRLTVQNPIQLIEKWITIRNWLYMPMHISFQ